MAESVLHLHISTTVISIKQVQVCRGYCSTTVSKCSLMHHIYQQRLLSQDPSAILKRNLSVFLLFVNEEQHSEEVRVKPQTLDGVVSTQVAHFLSQQQTERRRDQAQEKRADVRGDSEKNLLCIWSSRHQQCGINRTKIMEGILLCNNGRRDYI